MGDSAPRPCLEVQAGVVLMQQAVLEVEVELTVCVVEPVAAEDILEAPHRMMEIMPVPPEVVAHFV